MKKHVKLRKTGKFYSSYEDDAYVIHSILGYKVCNGKIGFPVNAIGKVINALEDNKINYVVIEKDEEIQKKVFPNNNYNKYLELGKKSSDKIIEEERLIEKVKELDSKTVDEIINYIREKIDEK